MILCQATTPCITGCSSSNTCSTATVLPSLSLVVAESKTHVVSWAGLGPSVGPKLLLPPTLTWSLRVASYEGNVLMGKLFCLLVRGQEQSLLFETNGFSTSFLHLEKKQALSYKKELIICIDSPIWSIQSIPCCSTESWTCPKRNTSLPLLPLLLTKMYFWWTERTSPPISSPSDLIHRAFKSLFVWGERDPCQFLPHSNNTFALPECWMVFKAGASQQAVSWLSHLSLTWNWCKCNCQRDTHSCTPSKEPELYLPLSCAVVVFSMRGMFVLFSLTFPFTAEVQQPGSWSTSISKRKREGSTLLYFA